MRTLVTVSTCLLVTACVDTSYPPARCEPNHAVLRNSAPIVREGPAFMLGGEPVRLSGANAYFLLEAARRGQLNRVREVMDDAVASGVTVLRVWAFNTDPHSHWTMHRGPDDIDESALQALDEVVAEAGRRGLRLNLVLSNGWSDYGGISAYQDWAGAGEGPAYASPAIRAWVVDYGRAILTRRNSITGLTYADDPSVFAVEVINEPRCESSGCTATVVSEFNEAVARGLRPVAGNTLIGSGSEGFADANHGDAPLPSPSALDWVSAHVWPLAWAEHDLPGEADAWSDVRAAEYGVDWIDRAADRADAGGLPLVVGEMGVPIDSVSEARRAQVVGTWYEAASQSGADLVAVWQFTDTSFQDVDGYSIRFGSGGPMDAVVCRGLGTP